MKNIDVRDRSKDKQKVEEYAGLIDLFWFCYNLWSLGTIKASQIVVLNEDMLLLLNKNSYQ